MSETPNDYETIVTRITLTPKGEPIYHGRAWAVEIDDDAAGEYLRVRSMDDESREIRIDASEWPALREAFRADWEARNAK